MDLDSSTCAVARSSSMGNGKDAAGPGVNGYRGSGVQSEMPPEKGNWDNLFFEVKKAALRSETWEHSKARGHERSTSNATV